MDPRYAAWITAKQDPSDKLQGAGKCRAFSEEMAKQFPELRVVAGWYYDGPHQRGHWWCETEDGEVIDPTARQFMTCGIGLYVEVPEEERPIGKCMNCGDWVFPIYEDGTKALSSMSCSKFCHDELMEAFG